MNVIASALLCAPEHDTSFDTFSNAATNSCTNDVNATSDQDVKEAKE